jgi:membrane protease YdiL (CAAX protease family)
LGQLYYLFLIAVTLAIVLGWERRPLSSVGLRAPTWGTLGWSIVAAVILMRVVVPLTLWLVSRTGLPLFQSGLEKVLALPVWFRLLAIVVTGGLFEEFIYRGYATERLSEVTGSTLIGSLLALSAFAWMHYPLWGLGPVLTFYFTGGFLTLLYLWKRDLVLNMLCHIIVDIVGLILTPPI